VYRFENSIFLENFLKKYYSQNDTQNIMKNFEKEYKKFIENLSLDRIERIAKNLQPQ